MIYNPLFLQPASRIGDAVDGPGPSKSLGKSLAYRQKQEGELLPYR